jgi:hypothetical protein
MACASAALEIRATGCRAHPHAYAALESAWLGFSGKSKARLAGLLSKVGSTFYEDRVWMREANNRRPSTGQFDISAKLLGELAVSSVVGPSRPKRRRVRLQRAKRPAKTDGSCVAAVNASSRSSRRTKLPSLSGLMLAADTISSRFYPRSISGIMGNGKSTPARSPLVD